MQKALRSLDCLLDKYTTGRDGGTSTALSELRVVTAQRGESNQHPTSNDDATAHAPR